MKNTLILILMALFLFLAIYFYWQMDKTQSQLTMAEEKITSLEAQVKRYATRGTDDTMATLSPSQPSVVTVPEDEEPTPPESTTFEDELGTLSQSDIQRLKKKGLKNPEADLMNDLMRKQKSVLTAQGTAGGTMAIRDIRILNDRYAMAYFEDGHFGGNMVLRYSVDKGMITWNKLDSYILN